MSLQEQIQVISDKVDYISQNTQFTLTTVLAVLAVAVAIAGVAFYKWSVMQVEKGISDGLIRVKEELKKELKLELETYIKDNPQIRWAHGNNYILGNEKHQQIHLRHLKIDEFEGLVYMLDVRSNNNPQKILEYTYMIENNRIVIDIHNYSESDRGIEWTVIWIDKDKY